MIDFSLIGLSGRDKRVYEALLSSPRSSVRKIAEDTGINRGSVFESIKDLVAAGLVAHLEEGKRRQYTANSPELLHEIITERRRELRLLQGEVDEYVSSLQVEDGRFMADQFATFYEGNEGLANILRDVLSTCRQQGLASYRVITSPRVAEYMYHNYPHYTRERVAQGLSVKSLRQVKPQQEDAELAEARLLKGSSTDTGCYILIYGTKVATISIDEYSFASGIVIDNAGVAAAQTLLFEDSWEASKP